MYILYIVSAVVVVFWNQLKSQPSAWSNVLIYSHAFAISCFAFCTQHIAKWTMERKKNIKGKKKKKHTNKLPDIKNVSSDLLFNSL